MVVRRFYVGCTKIGLQNQELFTARVRLWMGVLMFDCEICISFGFGVAATRLVSFQGKITRDEFHRGYFAKSDYDLIGFLQPILL